MTVPTGLLRASLQAAAALAVAAAAVWAALALLLDGPPSRPLAGLLSALVLLASALPLLAGRGRWRAAAALPFLLVLGWWLGLRPSNQRDWQPDVARAPRAERAGSEVTVHDVRSFHYRGSEADVDPRYETRRYDLERLSGLDLFVSFWGPTLYAHTILSFQFTDAPPLAVSIETRKEKGESYSALRGFFRQYELVYVAADERDVVRLRTGYRGETVYLYRLATTRERVRALFEQYLDEMTALAREPRWYNALTYSCTTTIWHNVKAIAPDSPFDWRLLLNGYLDELAWERGMVDRSLPLAVLRQRSNVTARAKACHDREDFSDCIREGLPLPAARRAAAAP